MISFFCSSFRELTCSFPQLEGLDRRVGIESFACVVRNSPETTIDPWFYWSRPEMEDFMGIVARSEDWDTTKAVVRFEAFAVAGCDVASKFQL
jgi:hypothetical protein